MYSFHRPRQSTSDTRKRDSVGCKLLAIFVRHRPFIRRSGNDSSYFLDSKRSEEVVSHLHGCPVKHLLIKGCVENCRGPAQIVFEELDEFDIEDELEEQNKNIPARDTFKHPSAPTTDHFDMNIPARDVFVPPETRKKSFKLFGRNKST
jgi:hypothetical protein